MGILGTLSYPSFRRRLGLERTGLFASGIQISCLCLCVVAIFLPGSPFVLLHPEETLLLEAVTTTTSAPFVVYNATDGNHSDFEAALAEPAIIVDALFAKKNQFVAANPFGSYVSIGIMMAGIIAARFGLWNLDLTITQILQVRDCTLG